MEKILQFLKAKTAVIAALSFFSGELPPKKWASYAVFSALAVFLFFAGAVFLIDPYVHYRQRSLIPTAFTRPYWQIAGVLRYYRYDSVIIGSSTAQNFNLALFRERLGLNPVKATASACYTRSGSKFADAAMKFNPKLKTIIYGLDIFAFFMDADEEKSPQPDFLYSGKHDQDWCYWWNFDMLRTYLKDLQRVYTDKDGSKQFTDPDIMFSGKYKWDLRHHGFSLVAASLRKGNFRTAQFLNQRPRAELMECFRANIGKNLIPMVERYPSVKFIFYLSPSSALNFADAKCCGALDLLFALRQMLADRLMAHENVTFYDFHVAPETLSVDNYKDLAHYVPMLNDRMTLWMQQGKYRLSSPRDVAENNRILVRYADETMPLFTQLCRAGGLRK